MAAASVRHLASLHVRLPVQWETRHVSRRNSFEKVKAILGTAVYDGALSFCAVRWQMKGEAF